MAATLRTAVIGSGNVAEAIALAAASSEGTALECVIARNPVRGAEVASLAGCSYVPLGEDIPQADIYVICVSDKAVHDLSASVRFPKGCTVAHTAGAIGIEALACEGTGRAVLYPFQTFTKGRRVDFSRVPLFIEGSDPAATAAVSALARSLSGTVLEADSERRRLIHLAGVFACNFPNRLFGAGRQILMQAGLDFGILAPIILETTMKALDSGDPDRVQTGPAVRGDTVTRTRHLEIISDPSMRDIYNLLSDSIWETSRKI